MELKVVVVDFCCFVWVCVVLCLVGGIRLGDEVVYFGVCFVIVFEYCFEKGSDFGVFFCLSFGKWFYGSVVFIVGGKVVENVLYVMFCLGVMKFC